MASVRPSPIIRAPVLGVPGEQAAAEAAASVIAGVVARGPGAVALLTDDECQVWSAAMRTHREAWIAHYDRCISEAVSAYDDMKRQGLAAGWWTDPVPETPHIPIANPDEAAGRLEALCDDPAEWAWQLVRAVRKRRGVAA